MMYPPLLLHYYITLRCNCNCSFCDIQAPKEAEYKKVIQNLRDARKSRILFVDFTGGEPLLHPRLPDMLSEAKSLGYKTSVTTNGLLYTERARELAGLVDFLHISLDSLDAEEHNTIRGRSVFDAVMRSIDTARQIGEHPDILYTVTPQTIAQLSRMVCFAQSLQLMLLVNPIFTRSPHLKLKPYHFKKLERYAAVPYVYVNKAFHRLRKRGGNQRRAPLCRVMDAAVVISPDNHVMLPCFHYAQTRLSISDSLQQVFRHPRWIYYHKKQGRLPVCQGCEINCYFDPSFHYQLNAFFRESLTAKLRYSVQKTIQRHLHIGKPAYLPANKAAEQCRLKKELDFY